MKELHSRNQKFEHLLCCPVSRGPVHMKPKTLDVVGTIKEGWIVSTSLNRAVGLICNYKWCFLHFDPLAETDAMHAAGDPHVLSVPCTEFVITPSDSDLHFLGAWETKEHATKYESGILSYSQGRPDDAIILEGNFSDVALRLHCHQWAGVAEVLIDGVSVVELDTFLPRWSRTRYFEVARNLGEGLHRIEIRPSKRSNPDAKAQQLFFREMILTAPVGSFPGRERMTPYELRRAMPHNPLFADALNEQPDNAYVLEVGGGDRYLGKNGYLNIEYVDDEFPGVICDALQMPFKNGSFDAVISQAVIEHVRNPHAFAIEVERVTAPGGVMVVGGAFMQRIHLEPWHYFNVTPYGMCELFGHLDEFKLDWNGSVAHVVDWMLSDLPNSERFTAERKQIHELMTSIQNRLTHDQTFGIALGVTMRGRKPRD